jgi:hypothetical protein
MAVESKRLMPKRVRSTGHSYASGEQVVSAVERPTGGLCRTY